MWANIQAALDSVQATLLTGVDTVNNYLSNWILLILLVGIGLFYTVRTRFVQVRCFGEGMKNVFGNFKMKGEKNGKISSFQAVATAIAAQVGTGNIVGACGAILVGGPGAIFWMWIIAFFGMATIYAEAVLAQKTRVVDEDGTVRGGPVYYIRHAFKGWFGKFLAGFFAVAAIIALGFVGAMVQSNSIAGNVVGAFSSCGMTGDTSLFIVKLVTGVIVAALAGLVLFGGTKRLASVTEKMVPVMAILYLIGGVCVLVLRMEHIPEAIGMIFKYAFKPQAIAGGTLGAAIMLAVTQGAKRGLFSNEAGMGSTPHAHALADVKDPHTQGTTAMIGVFIDTFVVLTMTALIVITTLYASDGIIGQLIQINGYAGNAYSIKELLAMFGSSLDGSNMAQQGVAMAFGASGADVRFGSIFIAICLFFFAFSTILSWNYFGKVNFEHLFGKKSATVYGIIAVAFVFLGSIFSNDLVWALTDMFNNLMVIPNVMAIAVLSGMVVNSAWKKKKACCCCCECADAEAVAAEVAADEAEATDAIEE